MHYPALFIDTKKAISNIKRMVAKANKKGVELRPHFKTHQSHQIGNWFRQEGVKSITVSSIKMAEYFAKDGWKSITIAFPVNVLEVERMDKLASSIDLRVLATDISVLEKLNKELSNKVGVYIELDPNYNRSGIPILNFSLLSELKEFIQKASNLRFEGFYTHAGHSYKCRSKEEIETLSTSILNDLNLLKKEISDPICFGDTPSCSVLEEFGPIDQICPGNFVFFDWTQFNIGSCEVDDIAVAMYCPVVAKYPERNELLIHGGAVHFSKDFYTDSNGIPFYGVVAELHSDNWGNQIPGNVLKSISQEHGVVRCTSDFLKQIEVGDILPILPIHSCLTADLMGEYYTFDGEHIDHMNEKVFR